MEGKEQLSEREAPCVSRGPVCCCLCRRAATGLNIGAAIQSELFFFGRLPGVGFRSNAEHFSRLRVASYWECFSVDTCRVQAVQQTDLGNGSSYDCNHI